MRVLAGAHGRWCATCTTGQGSPGMAHAMTSSWQTCSCITSSRRHSRCCWRLRRLAVSASWPASRAARPWPCSAATCSGRSEPIASRGTMQCAACTRAFAPRSSQRTGLLKAGCSRSARRDCFRISSVHGARPIRHDMMPLQYDAIIVGGGPAGATAAIRLARAGWSVALIEGESFPRRKVCGECIAASNLPLLDALGVGERFAALAGPPLRRVALLWGRESISAPLPAAAGSRQPWGRALGREQLDLLLLERARQVGVAVWQPYTAQSLGGSPGAYCCVLRPTRDHGQISAGCDSAASPGAASLSLTAPVAIAANGSWQRLPAARAQQPT